MSIVHSMLCDPAEVVIVETVITDARGYGHVVWRCEICGATSDPPPDTA